jgi:hypothetical protein
MDILRINDYTVNFRQHTSMAADWKLSVVAEVSWSVRAAPPAEDSETFGTLLEMPRDAG